LVFSFFWRNNFSPKSALIRLVKLTYERFTTDRANTFFPPTTSAPSRALTSSYVVAVGYSKLQVSISPTFYVKCLRIQIPKAQKGLTAWPHFCAFGFFSCKSFEKNVDEINPRSCSNNNNQKITIWITLSWKIITKLIKLLRTIIFISNFRRNLLRIKSSFDWRKCVFVIKNYFNCFFS